MMRQTWKIAQWEIMRNLRNKQFIIGLLITPLIMLVFAGLPRLLERWNEPQMLTYYVVDETQSIMDSGLTLSNVELKIHTGGSDSAEAVVRDTDATGYLVISAEFLKTGEASIIYQHRNHEGVAVLQSVLTNVLQQARVQETDMDREQLVYLTSESSVVAMAMEDADVPDSHGIVVGIASIVLVFFLVFSSGTMLMQSALQEKRDRMAEVVLSSISSSNLMQGKIIGHFLLGILQLGFWLLLGLPAVIYLLDFPVLEALASANLPLIIFFVLGGYLLFSAVFVGIGATMEDLQSAGNSQGLVIMIPMMSFLFIAPVVQNPDGIIAQVASIFPITSPVIMIMRAAITRVPMWQIMASAVALGITVVIIGMMAAKIFRIGMLMYGKTADMGEIMKWLRYKDVG